MKITSRTRMIALLGDPVAHSLSPLMQNAAFRAAGVDAVYVAIRCGAEEVPALIRAIARSGGGGNITVPHKAVAAGVGTPTARVARLGAANVFGAGPEGGPVVGNTDVDGILALVRRLAVPAATWAVIGTGGSARAIAGAALEAGVSLAVRSRSAARAADFSAWCTTLGIAIAPLESASVIINATPLGLHAGDALPVDLDELPALRGVLDLTYRADGPTPLVQRARDRHLQAEDGREMLLVQGAAGWSTWFADAPVAPPLEVMRAALAGRLG
jgi:shikimate dehydrogenase